MIEKNSPKTNPCYLYAIRLLAKRDYSEFKIRQKMREKKFEETEIDKTIQRLLELNYLREDEYIRARIKDLIHKNYSANYIQQKLKQEYCEADLETIYQIYDELGIDEETQKQNLIFKKAGTLDLDQTDIKIKAKVYRFLQNKGHSLHSSFHL